MKRLVLTSLALLVGALPLTACGAGSDTGASDKQLTVLAASSLTGVFGQLKTEFEKDHPGVKVSLAFDSSTTLATQVVDGAPGDVLATADATSMKLVTDKHAEAAAPQQFATNTMVIVVPADNPAGIATLDDLRGKSVRWVMCDPSAPCGKLAQTDLDANGVTAKPASLEVDVKSVLAKVTSGEADAGLVYATDATSAGGAVKTIAIPHSSEHLNDYFIAPVSKSALASDWVTLVTGSDGKAALAKAGFGTP